MEKKTKLLNPKLDVVFQALFGEQGSERITKSFLERILDIEIEKIELNQNPILRRENIEDKLGILDVIAKINDNQNIDIEMQIANNENIKNRMLYYWSKLYVRSIKKAEDYEKLEKSMVILISDKKIKGLEELECHTEWKIIETKNRTKILTDKLELHIIELEKIKTNIDNISKELLNWLIFLENPESERVNKMENDEIIKEAREKLEKISNDEQMQQLAWWREKGIYEENERKREIREIEKGREEIKQGREEIKQGREEIKQGKEELQQGKEELQQGKEELQQGKEELQQEKEELQQEKERLKSEKKQIVKKLLENKIPINMIIEITGLSKEEIEKIK